MPELITLGRVMESPAWPKGSCIHLCGVKGGGGIVTLSPIEDLWSVKTCPAGSVRMCHLTWLEFRMQMKE